MAIKFLLDKALQEQQQTIAKVLEVVKKKPYPTIETGILGAFTHSLFQVGEKFRPMVDEWKKEDVEEEDDKERLERKGIKEVKEESKTIEEQKIDLERKERFVKELEKAQRLLDKRLARKLESERRKEDKKLEELMEAKSRVTELREATRSGEVHRLAELKQAEAELNILRDAQAAPPPEIFSEKMPFEEEHKPKKIPLPQPPLPPELAEAALAEMPAEEEKPVELAPSAFDEIVAPETPEIDLDKLGPPEDVSAPEKPVLEKSEFKKREYVLNAFGRPIGVLVDIDTNSGKPKYNAVEPNLDESVLLSVKGMIKKDFQRDKAVLDDDAVLGKYLKNATKKFDTSYSDDMIKAARYYLKRDLMGFRRIEALMDDEKVRGIYCEGLNKPVLVKFEDIPEKIETNIVFTDPTDLNVLLLKLAKATGNDISEENPIMNVVFQGFRIQGTMGVGGVSSKLIIEKIGA
jgi:hypothetical protein